MRIFMNEEKKGKEIGENFPARFERSRSLEDGVAKREFTHSINTVRTTVACGS